MQNKPALLFLYVLYPLIAVFVAVKNGICAYTLVHLMFLLAVPLLGIWCRHRRLKAGYVCLGILLMYAFLQMLYLLY